MTDQTKKPTLKKWDMTCDCHWEGHVLYVDTKCIVDTDNPRYTGGNLIHEVPRNVPPRIQYA